MAVTVQEALLGRKFGASRASRAYIIKGAAGESAALVALLENAPDTVGGMLLSASESEVEEVAPGVYNGTAGYVTGGISALQQPGSFSIQFDISGQSQHIRCGLKNQGNFPVASAQDFGGLINVNPDGSVDGTDIIIPAVCVTRNYTVPPAQITDAYIVTLARTVGRINKTSYKGFEPGELLLTRASGTQRDGQAWDLSLGFAVSENKTNFQIGGITVPLKRGWDFAWVYYKPNPNTTAKVTAPIPSQVSVEQVYFDAEYAVLGLP